MVQPSSAMADANPEDLSHVSGPESSTGSTTPRAPKKSRPTAARKSSGVIQTRARKLRAAAASRIRKSPAGSTPNSRPRSQASRKMAATSKAATTVPLAKTSNVTTAEAAAAITPILRPPTLRFEAPQQPETATRDTIAAYLSGFTATKSVRVNHRRNLVAVDTVASGDISALLGVKKIADIPVKAKILETDTCVGTIYGVDADIAAEELAAIIDSSVPLESCVRRGNAVHITFSGTVVPAEVHLYKQRRPVRARLPRPLQCARCGIYGHATATCARDRRCLRCGKSHAEGPCPSERPRCLNCQGTHAANEPRCSSWQIQRQAAFLLAASRGKLTRRQALERAQTAAKGKQSGVLAATTTRPGHSFRDALKGRANAAPTSRTGPAGTSASASTPSSAPTSADDPRDTVMAALAAALRALLNSVVCDSPAREMCAAALAAHQSLGQHG
ncbi:hypothetical protein HPB52_022389 [Rhipicephalus sanguineus]|uniref:Gag-like protein n=1 Tax=Rhipicephalus sanguineus TaxID=34632 RepID=A0A9D4T4T7_RHISA|nr:hypothetical protein HPB52_022389 [Rhipicephalus sanguineus]